MHQIQKAENTQLSEPNVYIDDRGRIVNHIWGYQNSSSNFFLEIPENNTDGIFIPTRYKIFSSPDFSGKIYSLRNRNGEIKKINGVVEKEIPNYDGIEFTTILEKADNNYIYHHVTVKNSDSKPLDFSYMKSVDTDLDRNDNVPVYMFKDKEVMYIETNNYRLNYITNV